MYLILLIEFNYKSTSTNSLINWTIIAVYKRSNLPKLLERQNDSFLVYLVVRQYLLMSINHDNYEITCTRLYFLTPVRNHQSIWVPKASASSKKKKKICRFVFKLVVPVLPVHTFADDAKMPAAMKMYKIK